MRALNTCEATPETKHVGLLFAWGVGFQGNLVPVSLPPSPSPAHPDPAGPGGGRKACAGLLGCFLLWKLDGKLGLQPEARLPPQLPPCPSCLRGGTTQGPWAVSCPRVDVHG